MLVHPVVVASDDAGADIRACSNLGVAQVGKVISLGPFAQLRFLGLNKIAHVCILADLAAGTKVSKRPNPGTVRNRAFSKNAGLANEDIIAERAVLNHRIRTDSA